MEGSSDYFSGKSSEDVQEELEKNGFYNIEIVKDSNAGFLTELFGEENTVSKVTINGEEVVAGEKYWEDEEIVIYVFKK